MYVLIERELLAFVIMHLRELPYHQVAEMLPRLVARLSQGDSADPLAILPHVGPVTAEHLRALGLDSFSAIAEAEASFLTTIPGVTDGEALDIVQAAKLLTAGGSGRPHGPVVPPQ